MSTQNKNMKVWFGKTPLACAVMLAGLGTQTLVQAEEGFLSDWELSGYVRQHMSWNLQNPYLMDTRPALAAGAAGPLIGAKTRSNYRYDLSMARTTLKLNLYKDFGDSQFNISGRIAREVETNYLKDLQESMDGNANFDYIGGTNRNKSSINLMDDVYNTEEIRELWWQTAVTPSTTLKLGKQQVAWGETDFFQSLDVIQGYDNRIRSFLEPENEDVRKPLWMVNVTERFDSVDGSLQMLYIPGRMNSARSRGNSYDVEGGRWANNPNKGLSFEAAAFGADVPYNYDHKAADMDDASYGLRWKSMAGEWEYSLGWFHGPSQNPVINANPLQVNNATSSDRTYVGTYKGDYRSDQNATVGELIFPFVDVFGVTANRYIASLDSVFSAEVSYIPNSPFNIGLKAGEVGGCGFFPGFCGIIEKDVVKSMVRMDKQLALQNYLGTSRPSFFSVQLFNTWIANYDRKEEIVNTAGFSGRGKEFSTIATAILAMNYDNDRINPTLAFGTDLTYGGSFVVPSVEFAYGNNWRVRVEADLFFNDERQKRALTGFTDTNLFGYFDGNDQLAMRLTYQF